MASPSVNSTPFTSKLTQAKNKLSVPHHPPHFKTIITSANSNHKQGTTNGLEMIRHKQQLSEVSTWGIGGPCNYFTQVTTHPQLISALRYCHDHSIRFLIVGKGSNCLFDDSGFDGCVILNQINFVERIGRGIYRVGSGYPFNRLGVQCCNEGFSGLEFAGGIPGTVGGAVYMNAGADGQETAIVIDSVEVVTLDDSGFDGCVILNQINFVERIGRGIYRVGSGYPFNRLGVQCCNEGFSGLEFAGGIPGTVGGAVYMNAGADGQETAIVIDSVEVVTLGGRHQILNRKDLSFSYRRSTFQTMEDFAAITAVTFRLTPSTSARERQKAFLARRKSTQPLGERSAGSVFQNPSGFSAGRLIENAGLKGYRLGGAKVSEIHANFFINSGSSTSRDMLELIHLAKEKVDSKFGIQLKEEVRYIKACDGKNFNTKYC